MRPGGNRVSAGKWPEDLPSDRPIVYVQEGLRVGDGSPENPYVSVRRAVQQAPANAVVAVAVGTYDGRVEANEDVTVWGACPERTILTHRVDNERDTVVGLLGGKLELRNISVKAPKTVGIYVGGGDLIMRDVVLHGAIGFGVYATGGSTTADLENVIIRDIVPSISETAGTGIQVIEGAQARLHRVAISGSADAGLVVTGGTARISRSVLAHTTGKSPVEQPGIGLHVENHAVVHLEESALVQNKSTGIYLAFGATLEARDILIQGRGTEHEPTDLAFGMEVRAGAQATIDGALIDSAFGAAIATAENSTLLLVDATLQNTAPVDEMGAGLVMDDESQATLSGVLVDHSIGSGMLVRSAAQLNASDIWVRDTVGTEDVETAPGLLLFGRAQIERAVVEGSTAVGMYLGNRADASLADVMVRETGVTASTKVFGIGIQASGGARLRGQRCVLDRNRMIGLTAGAGSHAQMTDLVVRLTEGEPCEQCDDGARFGYGVAALEGSSMNLEDFVITSNRVLGILIERGSTLDGSRGEVSHHPIAINIQDPSFDFQESLVDVSFLENERNVDASMIPLPDTVMVGFVD